MAACYIIFIHRRTQAKHRGIVAGIVACSSDLPLWVLPPVGDDGRLEKGIDWFCFTSRRSPLPAGVDSPIGSCRRENRGPGRILAYGDHAPSRWSPISRSFRTRSGISLGPLSPPTISSRSFPVSVLPFSRVFRIFQYFAFFAGFLVSANISVLGNLSFTTIIPVLVRLAVLAYLSKIGNLSSLTNFLVANISVLVNKSFDSCEYFSHCEYFGSRQFFGLCKSFSFRKSFDSCEYFTFCKSCGYREFIGSCESFGFLKYFMRILRFLKISRFSNLFNSRELILFLGIFQLLLIFCNLANEFSVSHRRFSENSCYKN